MKNLSITIIIIMLINALIIFSCKKDDSGSNDPVYITVKDKQGNSYKAITVGTQTWMIEPLRVTCLNDGTLLDVEEPYDATDMETPAYDPPNPYLSDELKLSEGVLYNYAAIKTGKLAPEGWHVPTDEDWNTLIENLGGADIAGGKMKSTSTKWRSPNTGATNESKMDFIPNRCNVVTSEHSGSSYASHVMCAWLSAPYVSFDSVKYYYLWYNNSKLSKKTVYGKSRFKVICVKGDPDPKMVYYKVDNNGLTSDINNFVSQSNIDKIIPK